MSAPATAWTDNMAMLYGNAGGAAQTLPPVTEIGGRLRYQVGRIVLNSQASGTVFHIARLPLGALLAGITLQASVTLGSSTLTFGDFNTSNLFASATTYTTAFAKQGVSTWVRLLYTEILTGYDAVTGQVTAQTPGQGGGNYEDILMTIGAAALPASGNLSIVTEYVID